MMDQTIMPPLTTSFGFTPNMLVGQSTMSAILPGSSEPRWSATPCVIAGLIVSLAR